MTKARNIADLLDANGDVKSGSLDNVPAVDLTNLSATNLTSGTIPNARITLDANEIPNISTDKLTSGTIPDARLPSTALNSNVDLTTLSASNLTSGTIPTARITALPSGVGGKVLQVLTATDFTFRTTTSTSFVTGSNTLSIDITPVSTSSKFLINVTSTSEVASGRGYYTIYRDSTNLGTANGLTENRLTWNSLALHTLDSPNTTSEITYQLYYRNNNGGLTYLNNACEGKLTVMEIAG